MTTVYQLIALQAAGAPQKIALENPQGIQLTYAQLNEQMGAVALLLAQMGLSPDDRVAVVLPNGVEMAVAFLAIASCVVCAPLNPNYQAAEFEFYLDDLEAKAVVVAAGIDSPVRAVAQARQIPIIELDAQTVGVPYRFQCDAVAMIAGQSTAAVPVPAPEAVALVLHTSGTTARPKIVPLTHANLCQSATNIAQTLNLTAADRSLNLMPLFHIHGLMGVLLSSLSVGGSVICSPGFDAAQILSWLRQYEPTWYSAVPTIHQAVLMAIGDRDVSGLKLRFLRSSSSSMPQSVLAALENCFNVPVIEAYGMTEAAHQIASNPLPPSQRKPGSVGRSAGPEIAIMDEAGELLAAGEVGEVVIRGVNVTLGYDRNPAANAKAFTQSWFRTGDQGYLDPEGYLFLQGRLKEIINRGGEKITPLEIDACLMELPEVHQAVAFAIPHPTLGEDLAAAVVLKPGATLTPEEIRAYLFAQVAPFKVPSRIILVDDIPKGPTGKLQRLELGKLLADRLQSQYIAPRDEVEQIIADVMMEILGCKNIGIEDNFFMIGGDSLRGIQVVSRISRLFDVVLPYTILFRYPTIEQLASEINRLRQENTVDGEVQDLLDMMAGLSQAEIDQMLAAAES